MQFLGILTAVRFTQSLNSSDLSSSRSAWIWCPVAPYQRGSVYPQGIIRSDLTAPHIYTIENSRVNMGAITLYPYSVRVFSFFRYPQTEEHHAGCFHPARYVGYSLHHSPVQVPRFLILFCCLPWFFPFSVLIDVPRLTFLLLPCWSVIRSWNTYYRLRGVLYSRFLPLPIPYQLWQNLLSNETSDQGYQPPHPYTP